MANQQRGINQSQKPVAKSRGALFSKQETGYMLITMLIDLQTSDKRSSVNSFVVDFDIPEEVEHLPADSLVASVDP